MMVVKATSCLTRYTGRQNADYAAEETFSTRSAFLQSRSVASWSVEGRQPEHLRGSKAEATYKVYGTACRGNANISEMPELPQP